MPWYLHDGVAYTGDRVAFEDPEILERPSPNHQWVNGAWVSVVAQNWEGLMISLRGTPIYAKLYVASTQPDSDTVAALTKTIQANTALTLLQDSIKFQSLTDMEFAIAQLRSVLASTTLGDFSPEEIDWINTQLSSNGFPLQLE